ncbi:WG repeat-containing protein [Flavobacterium psychrophilum]|uniref:WG repeat-containing protein n=1 Tax=Flavobacterium psychrophilum TaxID=96345 RepID=UPI001D099A32|nr:WG repeat-containing protein [Flavobacterium psychrophilum]MCB6062518.1 WG repeat-containing protein [Flavobacterium psychrophilum]
MKNRIKLIIIFYLALYQNIYSQVIDVIDSTPISKEDRKFLEIKGQGINIEYTAGNYLLSKKSNKYGVLNKKYSTIIPFEYDAIISLFKTKDSLMIVAKDNKYFTINKHNKIISKTYDYMFGPYQDNLFMVRLNGKYTFIDSKGKEFKNWYEKELFFEGNYCVVSINNKFGIIDKKENLIIPIIYEDIKKEVLDNQIIVKNGKFGIVNLQNQIIIPFEYDDINFSNIEGSFLKEYRVTINDKIGIINKENKFIVNPIYDKIYQLNEGFRKAQKGNYLGLLDKNGNEVIPFEYNGLYKFENKERLKVSKDKLWGIIDLKNNLILSLQYQEISKFSYQENNEYSKSNLIYKVSIDGKKNMIVDESNNIIIKE